MSDMPDMSDMSEPAPPQNLRERVQNLAQAALERQDPSGWFEDLYAQAGGDASQVPWAKLVFHPQVQDWWERYGQARYGHNLSGGEPESDQGGKRAIVVGCGLGDDAETLAAQGLQTTAFDISPTAIAWCRDRFPNSAVDYQVADLFRLNPNWIQAFDLVVECRNLQALPLSVRSQAVRSVAQLVAPQGTLLVVERLRTTEASPEGPPWPFSNSELAEFGTWGLQEVHRAMFQVQNPETQNNPSLPLIEQVWVEYVRG